MPSAGKYTKNLNQLGATRISVANALNDADSFIMSEQAELMQLKEELRELGESDPAAECKLDGTA